MSDPNSPHEPAYTSSSFSAGGGDCVEVRRVPGGGPVAVRHSKMPDRATLVFTPSEWSAFVKGVKAGEFDPI